MEKKNLMLFLGTAQFGHHIGNYYYCRYKPKDFEITYIGCSKNLPEISLDGILVITVPFQGGFWGKIKRKAAYFFAAQKELALKKYDLVFIKYFPFCSLLKLLHPKTKFVMDIRSGSVQANKIKNLIANLQIRIDAFFFKHISIISHSLAAKLRIREKKYYLLPLGAEIINLPERKFDSLRLLYVGTFFNRNLHLTVSGLYQFIQTHPEILVSYRIIGRGAERTQIEKAIAEFALDKKIHVMDYIPHEKLTEYWSWCNVGIAFIPMTPMFDVQPPTKTFEYLAAGIPVLATGTFENRLIINESNGVLCEDCPSSFAKGLEKIWINRQKYHSKEIVESIGKYTWDEISKDLYEYLRNIINNNVNK